MMRLLLPLVILITSCLAQAPATMTLANGVRLRFVTDSGNGTPGPLKTELKPASYNSVYRIFRDESGLAVYAYELRAVLTPDGDHFRLTAEPAGTEFAAKVPYADGGKPTPTLPRVVESTPLAPGGRFTIDIPTNPGLWEHRTDTIQIEPPLGAARDRKAPAAALRFVGLQVFVNGKLVSPAGPGTMVSGKYVMFYVPGRGGYFFSTAPIYTRLVTLPATVDRTQVHFKIDDQEFLLNSEAPVLLESERGQVWVAYDRNYRPAGKRSKENPIAKVADEFFAASSESLGTWLQ